MRSWYARCNYKHGLSAFWLQPEVDFLDLEKVWNKEEGIAGKQQIPKPSIEQQRQSQEVDGHRRDSQAVHCNNYPRICCEDPRRVLGMHSFLAASISGLGYILRSGSSAQRSEVLFSQQREFVKLRPSTHNRHMISREGVQDSYHAWLKTIFSHNCNAVSS